MKPLLSVIIPCYNEARCIRPCLDALCRQSLVSRRWAFEIIVVLNGCTDNSAQVVRQFQREAPDAVPVHVLELPRPSKSAALNSGDAVAAAANRAYLDADVICEPDVLESLLSALDCDEPVYATGTIAIMQARSWVTTAYGNFWFSLIQRDVIGIGLYAVNAKGRARWDAFPSLHSDDKFVRLNFMPEERAKVAARYHWPLPEGWMRLLRVRLRWTEGNLELKRLYPDLAWRQTRARRPLALVPAALSQPVSFLAFFSVYIVCRLLARSDVETEGMQWRRAR